MRLLLALRTFFTVLFDAQFASQVRQLRETRALPEPEKRPAPAPQPPRPPAAPPRSDAVTLLEALQREARLLDLVQESLDAYSDQQVGAAARDVLRDTRAVLERMFALQPVVPQSEGETVEVAADAAGRFRLTGNVVSPPCRGRLVHHGWEATRCELPRWTGSEQSARVVAPAEVELS